MDMNENELTEWEAAFQANIHQSLDSIYDQFFYLVLHQMTTHQKKK